MKSIIVTGPIVYDYIMSFDGFFKDSIISEELDHLSISFQTESSINYFGGCGPNIAYTLKLLGENPLIFSVAGNDFDRYKAWLEKNDISIEYISIDNDNPTTAAYILNDKNQNQISIFSSGAAKNLALCNSLNDFDIDSVHMAIIAPDIPDRMASLAQECIEREVPYIFDPGQAITALSKEYLNLMIKCCLGLIVNKYEASMLKAKLGMPLMQIAKRAGFLIVTLGEKGCEIYQKDIRKIIPAVPGIKTADITGGGDAFRAGFIHGFAEGKSMIECCQMANTSASFAVTVFGTQEHHFTYDNFRKRLKKYY
ncbi:carbohydrate kinase family protein [Candidatus Peregrinibacteria bacterium]|nr:carbohydrate kinase family protein [Candidatus Peregrinibacteria bacterium]